MSLIKWTLAMAGTAIGLHYMSDRHRKRLADANTPNTLNTPVTRGAQTDRDPETPWLAPSGSGDNGWRTDNALGAPVSTVHDSDLQTPDSGLAPGSSAGRF